MSIAKIPIVEVQVQVSIPELPGFGSKITAISWKIQILELVTKI
jgi:hypothetical protein